MAKLILHIGTHKTGSTALQHALLDNMESLAREKIIYFVIPRFVYGIGNYVEKDASFITKAREYFRRELSVYPSDDYRLLTSFEGFSGNAADGYANTAVVAQSLREITDGAHVQIVVYLRPQDDFVESVYTQMVHQGEEYSFSRFIDNLSWESLAWDRFLEHFAEHFGHENITVRRYHKKFLPERNSIFSDFAQAIGAGSLTPKPGRNTPNKGFSRDALEVALLAWPHLDQAEKARLRSVLQRTSAKKPFERYVFFSADQRSEFMGRFAESNAVVARRYCGDESGELFPTGDGKSTEPYTGLTMENAVAILARAAVEPAPVRKDTLPSGIYRRIKAGNKLREFLYRFPRLKRRLEAIARRMGV